MLPSKRVRLEDEMQPRSDDISQPSMDTITNSLDLDHMKLPQQTLCDICRRLPYEHLLGCVKTQQEVFTYHETLVSMLDSAGRGCPLCSFLYKQLLLPEVLQPRPCKIRFQHNFRGPEYDDDLPGGVSIQVTVKQPQYRAMADAPPLYTSICVISDPLHPDNDKKRALTGNTGSAETFKQITSWLRHCDHHHHKCRFDSDGSFVPTRLLDLRQWRTGKNLRLILSKDITAPYEAYIALSHRWNEQIKLSSTKTENLRTRLAAVSPDILPELFVDVFNATSRLGINYLWIDSLCIVQDDTADWTTEAALMSQIYQNAYCTIAASGFYQHSSSLFRQYDVKHDFADFPLIDKYGESKQVRAMKVQRTWDELIATSALQSRGWCLQEREMSPRVVHWTEDQVIWECRTWTTSECRPTLDRRTKFHRWYPVQRTLSDLSTASSNELLDLWRRTVESYSAKHLTNSEDRFPALGGLARLVNHRLKSDYLAGLWRKDLRRSLLWTVWADHSCSENDRYIAPSWSWAAVNGPIKFVHLGEGSSDTAKGLASIEHCQAELATQDPYGAVRSGRLHLKGPALACDITQLVDGCLYGCNGIANFRYDIVPRFQESSTVRWVALYKRGCGDGIGIMLRPIEGTTNTYRRIGSVWGLRMALFEDADVEDIVII